jgi:hypothetical protein
MVWALLRETLRSWGYGSQDVLEGLARWGGIWVLDGSGDDVIAPVKQASNYPSTINTPLLE